MRIKSYRFSEKKLAGLPCICSGEQGVYSKLLKSLFLIWRALVMARFNVWTKSLLIELFYMNISGQGLQSANALANLMAIVRNAELPNGYRKGKKLMYAFELENVMFAYPNNIVLERFNFKVGLGDFSAMIGPNGAGKSTVVKLCVGLLKPISGQIKILGEPIAQFRNWKRIAYVSQNFLRERSFPATVAEVVATGRVAALGMGHNIKKEDREIINQSLEWVGMYEHRQELIGRLSGGQQQRIMIARALAAQASILVLDEPTAGIDSMATETIYALLKKLNTSLRTTIIVVSHDVEGIAQYAGKVIKINKGIEYYGTSATFRNPGMIQESKYCESSCDIGDGSHA